MVQILEEDTYEYCELGKSASLKTNQWCVSIGHASGFDPRRSPPIRLGRVLNNDRFLTTDSALIGGDSGGPLFDLEGRLIGIHSNIGMSLSQNNHVPIDAFHDNWDRMRKGETWGTLPGMGVDPNRPVLGIQLSREPGDVGARIDSVLPNSPADKAGMKAGDIVQQVNGRTVESAQEVIDQLGRNRVGEDVALKILRDDKPLEISAELIRASDLPPAKPDEAAGDEGDTKDSKPNPKTGKPQEASKDPQADKKNGDELDFDELIAPRPR